MSSTTDKEQLAQMLSIAGKKIMAFWQDRSFKISIKSDQSLVTDADFASEQSILIEISEYYPEDTVLAEESGLSGDLHGEVPEGGYVWIIDPLDGTTNFSNGYPFFCVSIARAKKVDGRLDVVLGGIFDPVSDRMYLAEKGGGATINGRPMQIRPERAFGESFLVTGFAYHKGQDLRSEIESFSKISMGCQSIRRDGAAALDLAMVAEGIYDGYWEKGLQPWDVAAGSLLVTEAGGLVVNYGSEAFDINQRSIICGNTSTVQRLRDYL